MYKPALKGIAVLHVSLLTTDDKIHNVTAYIPVLAEIKP